MDVRDWVHYGGGPDGGGRTYPGSLINGSVMQAHRTA